MTDHGWLDHHDDGDPGFHDEPQHFDDHHDVEQPPPPEHDYFDDPQHDHDHDLQQPDDDVHDHPYEYHADEPAHEFTAETHDAAVVEPETVFPPALDVGPLPEPVDGFPWIDTGSLGLVDPATVHSGVDPVDPHELAEYAGTELPPGADPWATLADSDDPATANLARWWSEHQQ
jgi:hypothetical protein